MVPIPGADQKDRGLWERDCLKFVTDPRFWERSLGTNRGKKWKNGERLLYVWKTWKFRGEFKWNGSSRWKFSGKKVTPFEVHVLPFSRFYRNDRNFLHHLFGSPVPGFKSRESEKFTGILYMVQLNPVPVFGAEKNTSTIWRKIFTER